MQPDIRATQTRELVLTREGIDVSGRTVEVAISSESPVERWFGTEILEHTAKAVDLQRLADGPVLVDHNTSDLVGALSNVRVDGDKVLRGTVRFGRSARAEEIWQDVQDGIRSKVSVGYQINQYTTTKGASGASDTIRATRWTPMEMSFVAVPADTAVGVGRSLPSTEAEPLPPTPATEANPTEVRMDAPTVTAPAVAPPVNLAELATKAAQEVLALRAHAAKFGMERDVEELLQTRSIAETRKELMFRMADKTPITAAPVVKLTEKEARSWSLVRAIAALIDQAEGRKASGFEVDLSQELAKRNPNSYEAKGGLFIPLQLRAGLDSATGTKGNELKFTEAGELIEMLRAEMILAQLGVRTLSGLSSPLSFPAQTAAATAYWLGENGGADVTASTLTLGSRTLTPKTLMATTSFSRQLVNQAVYGVEALVREDFAQVNARALDSAGIYGTGTAEPTGIYKTSNVNTTAWGGAATWAKLMDMVSKVQVANALTGSLGFVTNPTMAGVLCTKQKATNFPSYLWEGQLSNGIMAGYKALASSQISGVQTGTDKTGGAEQGIVFGNWNDAIIGLFGSAEIILDPYSLKKQGMIELTSFLMADFLVRHPGSFTVGTGLTTA